MNKPCQPSVFLTGRPAASTHQVHRHFHYLSARLPDAWWSAGFAFAMGVALLAASAAGQRSGVICFLGLTGLLALLFPHAVVYANARNALLWLFPAWAAFSISWSINPDRSMHSVMLLLPTFVAGLALGGMPHRSAVGAGLGAALVLYMTYSLGYGATTAFSDTGSGGEATIGITTGKNYFGHLSAITFLTAPMFLAFGRGRWTVFARGFALFAGAVGAFALFQSHATGSLLATALGTMVMLTVLLVRHVPWQFRIVVIAAVLGVMMLYMIFGQQLQDEVFNAVLRTFRKDASLTGRTILWAHADRLIEQHRMLGYGYAAFWYHTNPDAVMLWRAMGVGSNIGFNFHNTPREVLISLGASGMVLYVVSFGYALVRTGVRALSTGDITAACGLGFIAYFLVRMPVESTGFSELTIDTLLLLTFLSITLKSNRAVEVTDRVTRAPASPPRRATPAPTRSAAFPRR